MVVSNIHVKEILDIFRLWQHLSHFQKFSFAPLILLGDIKRSTCRKTLIKIYHFYTEINTFRKDDRKINFLRIVFSSQCN